MKLGWLHRIGDAKVIVLKEQAYAKGLLLIGVNALEKLKATLVYGKKVARLFGKEIR